VQAVACFYPPTDFVNWEKFGEDAVDYGLTHGFEPPLGPKGMSREEQLKIEKAVSPINYVSANMPPMLIIQGDRDESVPYFQTERFAKECSQFGVHLDILIKSGLGHSYPGWRNDLSICAGWFDTVLKKK
jgi:dipeptidyl aminopeptidase/acylaminoacyl peptidase